MPGYIIHLTEAEMIISLLNEGSGDKTFDDPDWKRMFTYGVLLPDAVEKARKKNSHFWREEDNGKMIITPDLSRFLDKYENRISEPLLYGCLAHLHLDKLFFEAFFQDNVVFLNREGRAETQFSEVESVYIHKSGSQVTPQQFFSEEYLYGDYTKLNHCLLDRYHLEIPFYSEDYGIRCGSLFEEADCRDLEKVLNKLYHFLELGSEAENESKSISESTLQVFSYDKLILFLEKAARSFVEGKYDPGKSS